MFELAVVFKVFVYVMVSVIVIRNLVVMIHNDNEEIRYHNARNDWDPRYTFEFQRRSR